MQPVGQSVVKMREGSAPNVIMRGDRGISHREQTVIERAAYVHPSPGAHFKYARYSTPTAVFVSMCRRFLISVATENISGFRTDRGHSCTVAVHLIHSYRDACLWLSSAAELSTA